MAWERSLRRAGSSISHSRTCAKRATSSRASGRPTTRSRGPTAIWARRAKAQEQLALYQKDKLGWPPAGDRLMAEIVALKTAAECPYPKGIELAESGQLQAAADEHEAALAADPRLVQAHVNLIILYGKLGQPQGSGGALPGRARR